MSAASGTGSHAIVRPPRAVRAIVCAGGVETEYLRAGSGETLVLLAPAPSDGGLVEELALALAERFRVFVPTPPADWPRGTWLSDFREGVGVQAARLVVLQPSEKE